MSKNDIYAKISILATSKKWLNIFGKYFIQAVTMGHIYNFSKSGMDIIEVWRRGRK
jgi:hypothetical protein